MHGRKDECVCAPNLDRMHWPPQPKGQVLGCTAPALGSQQQSHALPLMLEGQKGPHLPLSQGLRRRRALKYPACLDVVKEKPSPPKQLVPQQGKTWLEKGRRAVMAPQGKSHRPCIRWKQIQPVCVEERAVSVPQLYVCCNQAESAHLCAPSLLPLYGEAECHSLCSNRPRGKLQRVSIEEFDL